MCINRCAWPANVTYNVVEPAVPAGDFNSWHTLIVTMIQLETLLLVGWIRRVCS